MPVIKVWCLPPNQSEEELGGLHQAIVKAVVSIPELRLKDENDMTCLFPPDQMQYGLGSDIVVEVTGLTGRGSRTPRVKKELAASVGCAVKYFFRKTKIVKKVRCFVSAFDPKVDGFWSSDQ